MFHVKHYIVLNILILRMFHVKQFKNKTTLYQYNFTILFLIANTAACVLSETSIFLNMLDI